MNLCWLEVLFSCIVLLDNVAFSIMLSVKHFGGNALLFHTVVGQSWFKRDADLMFCNYGNNVCPQHCQI